MRDNLNSFLKTSSKNNEAANQRNRSIVFTSEIIEDSLKKEMSLSKGGRRKTKSVFDKKSEPYAKENKEDLNRLSLLKFYLREIHSGFCLKMSMIWLRSVKNFLTPHYIGMRKWRKPSSRPKKNARLSFMMN